MVSLAASASGAVNAYAATTTPSLGRALRVALTIAKQGVEKING